MNTNSTKSHQKPCLSVSSTDTESSTREICILNKSSSRVPKTRNEFNPKNFNLQNANQNLITIWKNIFLNCNLKTIFMLRSVSQMLHHLSTKISLNNLQILENEKVSKRILHISISELLNSTKMYATSKEFELCLIITGLYDLKTLLELAENNSNRNIITFIKDLDLAKIEITNKNSCFINRLLAIDFPELTKLAIGNISNCEVIFPKAMNKLINLSVGNIDMHSIIQLPHSLDNLKSFTLGDIKVGAEVSLPDSLNNITTLTVGNIETKTTLDLLLLRPNSLKTIHIGALFQGSTLKLPLAIDDLEILTFGALSRDVTLSFPKFIHNLTTLVAGNVNAKAKLLLPDSMSNLKSLTIGDLSPQARVELPIECTNLMSLTIGEMQTESSIKFSTMFADLATIEFGHIDAGVIFELPSTLEQVINLEFDENQDTKTKEMLHKLFFKEKRDLQKNKLENCCCQ